MASFIDKIRIPKATEHFSSFNLDCDHVTTQDFFKLKPIYIRPLVPGQSINVEVSQTVRLMPLQKPFFGRCHVVNRAYFIPNRLLMEGWNEFITDTNYVGSGSFTGIPSKCPIIKASTIVEALANAIMSTSVASGLEDFGYWNGSSVIPKKFTASGKYFADILRCLGYQIDTSATREGKDYTLNAMPLLAYMKIYIDWFRNTNFSFSFDIDKYFIGVNKEITVNDLLYVVPSLYAPYDNDYFTASWSNPAGPSSGLSSPVVIKDVTNNFNNQTISPSEIVNGSSGNLSPFVREGGAISNSIHYLSEYTLQALKSLSDYMKRHQLGGYRALDRFRARFGVTLPDASLNRSNYLGKKVEPILITDVTSTADTDGAVLGQYTGFGISRGQNGNFSYKTEEYGYFMILSIIMPERNQYSNGLHRHLLDFERMDFYTPEMDGLGVQAIANVETKADWDDGVGNSVSGYSPTGTWAYIPRYGHLKCAQDWLTGDFKNKSMAQNMQGFHLFRDFSTTPTHNLAFCTGNNAPFDKVFNDTDPLYDHFICGYHFNVSSKAPMSPLFENYHFEEAGNEITQKIGGTKLS